MNLDEQFKEGDKILKKIRAQLKDNFSENLIKENITKVKIIFKQSNEITRYKILTDLIGMRCKEGISLFISALENDTSRLVRHEAAFGFGILGDSSHCELLVNALLHDESFIVRHEAAIALAEIGGKNELAPLIKAWGDSTPEVRASAQFAVQVIQLRLVPE